MVEIAEALGAVGADEAVDDLYAHLRAAHGDTRALEVDDHKAAGEVRGIDHGTQRAGA